MRHARHLLGVGLALTLVAGACASDEQATRFSSVGSAVSGGGGGWDCGDDCDWDSDPGGFGEAGADRSMALEDEGMPAPSEAPATTVVAPDGPTAPVDDRPVTAGSVDDNEAWEDYLLYRQWFDGLSPRPAVLDVLVEGRQVLTVVDADGSTVPGARIQVLDGDGAEVASLTTYADGRALFHPATTEVDPSTQRRPSYTALVRPPASVGGDDVEPVRIPLDTESRSHTLELAGSVADQPVRLDVAFLIDATGSMADEIDRLTANMVSVAEDIAALPGEPDVRFAMTVYRDHGDKFVTRTFDFTGDVDEFSGALREVVADGGGDYPEALEDGLHDALEVPAWRGDDTVKLVFLVADAPPHVSGPDDAAPRYDDDIRAAAARGIKVFPIASSGLATDPQGEYIFRQLAQITMGRFVFLTYGADGASPGEGTDHQVEPGSYDVLPLDELVVALVADELADLAG